jgi:hypothetical protein
LPCAPPAIFSTTSSFKIWPGFCQYIKKQADMQILNFLLTIFRGSCKILLNSQNKEEFIKLPNRIKRNRPRTLFPQLFSVEILLRRLFPWSPLVYLCRCWTNSTVRFNGPTDLNLFSKLSRLFLLHSIFLPIHDNRIYKNVFIYFFRDFCRLFTDRSSVFLKNSFNVHNLETHTRTFIAQCATERKQILKKI